MRGARTKFVEADMVNARGVDRVEPPKSRTGVESVEDSPADLVCETHAGSPRKFDITK